MRTVNLNKELLVVLHHESKKTIEQIAKLLAVSEATVLTNMHAHKLNIFFDITPETDPVVAAVTASDTEIKAALNAKKTKKGKHSTRRSLPKTLRAKLLNPIFLQKALTKAGSTAEAARVLGLHSTTLGQYVKKAKLHSNGIAKAKRPVGRPRTQELAN